MKHQKFSARRRQVIALGVTGAGAWAAPAVAMMTHEPLANPVGGKIVVSGRILGASDGQALAGAQIEIWPVDARGVRAEHAREVVIADGDGRYFAVLSGAAQRLHYRVSHQGYTARVTQMHVANTAHTVQRSVTLTRDDEGATGTTRAAFELTLAPRHAAAPSASSAPDFAAL